MDIKAMLEEASGEPVADTAFSQGDACAPPFICFLDIIKENGDMTKSTTVHSLSVERYSETVEDNEKFENWLKEKIVRFQKHRMWLPDPDDLFETIYDFEIIERT